MSKVGVMLKPSPVLGTRLQAADAFGVGTAAIELGAEKLKAPEEADENVAVGGIAVVIGDGRIGGCPMPAALRMRSMGTLSGASNMQVASRIVQTAKPAAAA